MTPDPDAALRRVLMSVQPQQGPAPQPMGVRAVSSLPPGPQVNLNPAMARQLALIAALRQRRGP